jgi:hypothetical protein
MKIKRTYNNPEIVCVELDNDISLALQSAPPIGPDETNNALRPEYFNTNPIKQTLG